MTKANNTFANYNELVAAVAKVNAQLMQVQAAVFASYEKQQALMNRNAELEKEIAELNNWNREAERYHLTDITLGVPAYREKPSMEDGEPTMRLCANCFGDHKRSFLQPEPQGIDS